MLAQRNLRRQRLQRAVLMGSSLALVFIVLWWVGAFTQVRLSLTSVYFTSVPTSERIVIVALDDAALSAYGRSPALWSRAVYADLLGHLADDGARVVAFDLLFSEPAEGDAQLVEAMQMARTSRTRTRIVLATAGIQVQPAIGGDTRQGQLEFSNALMPTTELLAAADYLGYANVFPDVDGLIRRQISQVSQSGQNGYAFSLASYLAYLRIPALLAGQVIERDGDTLFVTPESRLKTDANGLWLQNYFGPPSVRGNMTFPVVSVLDVVNERVETGFFTDKIVLVGLVDTQGATDRYPVPAAEAGRLMSGVEIQANAIETLLQDRALVEMDTALEGVLIVVLTLGASLLYAYPRWPLKLILMSVLVSGWWLLAFVVFGTQNVMLNLLHPTLALAVPAILSIGLDITLETRLRRRSEFLLESTTAISEQRLSLERILPLVANDIQRMMDAKRGAIWVLDDDMRDWVIGYAWPDDYQATPSTKLAVLAAERSLQSQMQGHDMVVPTVYQQRANAVISLDAKQINRSEGRALVSLRELTAQVAPNIENALLYNQVLRQRDIVETVLANSPASIVLVDQRGRIVSHNQAFEQTFGPPDEATPDLFDQFADEPSENINPLRDQLQQNTRFRLEMDVGGRSYQVDGALVETTLQWVLVFNDVTGLIELTRLKTRMIRMASHDLKNPLSRVSGYAQLIEMSTELEPEVAHFLKHIDSAANEMLTLITELLDLEQLQADDGQRETIDFARLVAEVFSRHEPDATRKGQQLTKDLSAGSVQLEGQHRQLSQMVSNLIGNAIKYTPDGGNIVVRLSQNDTVIRFEVEDDGIGIPKAAQAKLFTEFYRVKSEATANISGTGLGLSLVRSVAEDHHGKVGVVSEAGQGSLFFVELPTKAVKSTTLESDGM